MLELDGVSRRFGDTQALDEVSLRVARGEIVGFLGRNGAGKTTAMRVVFGLVRPDAGDVRWDGEPVGDRARLRFGYMPEERGLYPRMRVRAQLEYFAELSGCGIEQAQAATSEWMGRLGVAAHADDVVESLSLGNQQRVQLGAALVHGPDLLVLDEPFSGLDPVGVEVLAGVLRGEARRGAAVLFSSHQLDLVERLCDRAVIIEEGRVVSDRVDAMDSTATTTVEVSVAGARTGWADRLPGVTVLERRGDRLRVELAPPADVWALVEAAHAAGTLTLLRVEERGLADWFKEVTSARPDPSQP